MRPCGGRKQNISGMMLPSPEPPESRLGDAMPGVVHPHQVTGDGLYSRRTSVASWLMCVLRFTVNEFTTSTWLEFGIPVHSSPIRLASEHAKLAAPPGLKRFV